MFEIDSAKNRIHVTPVGRVTVRICKEIMQDVLRHPRFVTGMPSLWDLTDADLSSLNSASLREITDHFRPLQELRGRARIALFARADHNFGVARMFEVLGPSSLEIQAFRRLDEAEAWLDAARFSRQASVSE